MFIQGDEYLLLQEWNRIRQREKFSFCCRTGRNKFNGFNHKQRGNFLMRSYSFLILIVKHEFISSFIEFVSKLNTKHDFNSKCSPIKCLRTVAHHISYTWCECYPVINTITCFFIFVYFIIPQYISYSYKINAHFDSKIWVYFFVKVLTDCSASYVVHMMRVLPPVKEYNHVFFFFFSILQCIS